MTVCVCFMFYWYCFINIILVCVCVWERDGVFEYFVAEGHRVLSFTVLTNLLTLSKNPPLPMQKNMLLSWQPRRVSAQSWNTSLTLQCCIFMLSFWRTLTHRIIFLCFLIQITSLQGHQTLSGSVNANTFTFLLITVIPLESLFTFYYASMKGAKRKLPESLTTTNNVLYNWETLWHVIDMKDFRILRCLQVI